MPKFLTIFHDPIEDQALIDQIIADDPGKATTIARRFRGAYSNHVITLSVDEVCQIEESLCDTSEEEILAEQNKEIAACLESACRSAISRKED